MRFWRVKPRFIVDDDSLNPVRMMLAMLFVLLAAYAARADQVGKTEAIRPVPVIHIKPAVELNGDRSHVVLGDLLESRGLRAETEEKIGAIRLVDMPKPSEKRVFTDVGIMEVLKPYIDEIERDSGVSVRVRIPSRVVVMRKNLRITEVDIEKDLKRQWSSICGDCDFLISGLSVPLLPDSIDARAAWTLRTRPELPRGGFSVPLEIEASPGGGARRTYWVTGILAVRKRVPVAARAVMFGERLQASDFTMQVKDITYSSDVAASESEIQASIAARQFAAGQVIWRHLLRHEKALRRGEAVKVVAGRDGWQVSIDGTAESSAEIGDVVRVKIPRTKKIISGILRGNSVVEIQ